MQSVPARGLANRAPSTCCRRARDGRCDEMRAAVSLVRTVPGIPFGGAQGAPALCRFLERAEAGDHTGEWTPRACSERSLEELLWMTLRVPQRRPGRTPRPGRVAARRVGAGRLRGGRARGGPLRSPARRAAPRGRLEWARLRELRAGALAPGRPLGLARHEHRRRGAVRGPQCPAHGRCWNAWPRSSRSPNEAVTTQVSKPRRSPPGRSACACPWERSCAAFSATGTACPDSRPRPQARTVRRRDGSCERSAKELHPDRHAHLEPEARRSLERARGRDRAPTTDSPKGA